MQAEVSVKNMDINTFHDLRVWANRAILFTTIGYQVTAGHPSREASGRFQRDTGYLRIIACFTHEVAVIVSDRRSGKRYIIRLSRCTEVQYPSGRNGYFAIDEER